VLRLRRLLAIVTWLAQVREASITEIAERFELAEDEVVAELELAACCGSPPYTPDTLLDILIDGDRVIATLPGSMARPRRLTREEGFALATSAHAIIDLDGDRSGALATGLAKLDDALGTRDALVVAIEQPERVADLRRAVEERQRLEIEYYTASRDEVTVRTINPTSVFVHGGHGYVEAYCELAGGTRCFRADRIERTTVLGTQPEAIGHVGAGARHPLEFLEDTTEVVLCVDRAGAWVADSVPTLSSVSDGTWTWVTLSVASERWFAQLLLQLGPHATVLSPAPMAEVVRDAAERILARYRAS